MSTKTRKPNRISLFDYTQNFFFVNGYSLSSAVKSVRILLDSLLYFNFIICWSLESFKRTLLITFPLISIRCWRALCLYMAITAVVIRTESIEKKLQANWLSFGLFKMLSVRGERVKKKNARTSTHNKWTQDIPLIHSLISILWPKLLHSLCYHIVCLLFRYFHLTFKSQTSTAEPPE